ncbi:MAG: hypothetical protein K2M20_03780 [Lachnospiraceae bacterium]|nr:hypothetical protein [Lachnospiraceae bacterium]
MKNLLVPKGGFGYLDNRKKYTALRTLLFFLISGGLYAMGILTTGSNKNLLTIVAILGCLPACKSAVNFILFMRAKGCSSALHDKLSSYDDNAMTVFYDMYFTSYQKNYPLSHMALKGGMLCGITEHPSCSCREAEKHLEQMLVQEGIKNVTVNIFSQEDKYIDRLSRLSDMQAEEHQNREGIINLLYSISI